MKEVVRSEFVVSRSAKLISRQMRVHLISDKEDAQAKFGEHQLLLNFKNFGTKFVVEGVKLDKDMDEYYHESGDPKYSYGQMK